MTEISMRLAKLYTKLGITFDPSAMPSSNCNYSFAGKGFCHEKGECYAHSLLENRSLPVSGHNDKDFKDQVGRVVPQAIAKGCNVLSKQ